MSADGQRLPYLGSFDHILIDGADWEKTKNVVDRKDEKEYGII